MDSAIPTAPTTQQSLVASIYPNSFAGQQFAQQQPAASAMSAPPTAAPAHKGNFFTHALPTIGGIVGGIVGLPANLLDAVGIPGTLGDVAAAAGGSALGKTLENKLEGNSLGSGVLSNAVEGAAGQGIGSAIGKVGGAALGYAGSKATDIAPSLLKGQLAKGALGTDAAGTLVDAGVTKASQLPQIADIVTGKGGALNQGVEKALMKTGQPVEVADLIGSKMNPTGMAENLISQETSVGDTAGKKVLGTVNKAVQNMMGGPDGMIGRQQADPLDVLQQARQFDTLAAKARDTFNRTGNAEQGGVANIYSGLADELKSRLFNPGGQQLAVPDDVKSEILNSLGRLKDVNPTVYNKLVNQVSNAKTIEDLRAIQAPYVQGSKAAAATERARDMGAGTTGSQALQPIVGGGPSTKGTMLGLAAAGAKKIADSPIATKVAQTGGGILSNIGDSNVPSALGGALGVTGATSNNLVQPNDNAGAVTMTPELGGGAPQTTAPTDEATRQALLALAFYSPNALSSLTPNASQQQNLTNALAAEHALSSLPTPPSGGLLSNIAGHLGIGGTGEYQREAESAAEQVAAALPGSNKDAIARQLTDYMAGGANISDAVTSLLA